MTRPDPDRSEAVLIGTAGHTSPRLPPLPAVVNNLVELARVLSGPPVGLVGAGGITTVLDAASQQEAAIALLDRAERAEDLLLVYFAGHGLLDENGDLFLALHGTDPRPERLSVSALPFALVRRAIRESPARVRVLILDCCFSGVAIPAMSGAEMESLVADSTRVEGTYTLTATSENAVALAPPGEDHTAFTGELIHLLRAPSTGEDLTLAGVYRHLASVLPGRGHPRPQQRTTNAAGDLVLRPAVPTAPVVPVAPPAAEPPVVPTETTAPLRVLSRSRNPFHPVLLWRHAGRWLWWLFWVSAAATVWGPILIGVPIAESLQLQFTVFAIAAVVLLVRTAVTHIRHGRTAWSELPFLPVAGVVVVLLCYAPGVLVLLLLLIFLVQATLATLMLVLGYLAHDLRRFALHLDRDGLRILSGRQEGSLLWQHLERVWVDEHQLCVAFKPGYDAASLLEEIDVAPRFGGYVIMDLRLCTAPADEAVLALAHFAGTAYRRGPDRTPRRGIVPWRRKRS